MIWYIGIYAGGLWNVELFSFSQTIWNKVLEHNIQNWGFEQPFLIYNNRL